MSHQLDHATDRGFIFPLCNNFLQNPWRDWAAENALPVRQEICRSSPEKTKTNKGNTMKSPDTLRTDMSIVERGTLAGRKRPAVILFFILLPSVGLQQFFRVMDSPQAESYRTIDIARLVLAGACFGVVLVGLIFRILHPRR